MAIRHRPHGDVNRLNYASDHLAKANEFLIRKLFHELDQQMADKRSDRVRKINLWPRQSLNDFEILFNIIIFERDMESILWIHIMDHRETCAGHATLTIGRLSCNTSLTRDSYVKRVFQFSENEFHWSTHTIELLRFSLSLY